MKSRTCGFRGSTWTGRRGCISIRSGFYDPDVGRFTTPDPIGLAGGINLYAYAPNPAGYADPLGLSCTSPKGFARKKYNNQKMDWKNYQEKNLLTSTGI
ncbi:RHS repeat-associated core domain-containing protein [Pseudomonas lini]